VFFYYIMFQGGTSMDNLANLCTQAATSLTPDILNHLVHLTTNGHAERVKSHLMDCIEQQPHNVQLWKILAVICVLSKSDAEAECAFETAVSLAPDDRENTNNFTKYLLGINQIERALTLLKDYLSRNYDPQVYTYYLFQLAMYSNDKAYVFSQFNAYEDNLNKYYAQPTQPLTARSRSSDDKIRIGYISADFREHPISLCIKPILMMHNQEKFEVHCINSNLLCDQITQQLSQIKGTIWHHVGHQNNLELTNYIRALQLDVLIDLAGHTAGNRLPVFFWRAAPVQMTWMGSVYTTGLSQMDWRITTRAMAPDELKSYYTEKLFYLPCLGGWAPMDASPNICKLPALKNKYVTFGSLNDRRKINDDMLAAWSTLLARIPTARLIIISHDIDIGDFREKLQSIFKRHQVEKRIELLNAKPLKEFLALMNKIDINLDPFPVSGGTTTLHAAWMGLPTITLNGDTEQSRVSASIIKPLGLEECITENMQDYIDAAVKLANDTKRLATLRGCLRQRLAEQLRVGNETIVRALEAHIENIVPTANNKKSTKRRKKEVHIEHTGL
jgi:protein O-GlcNAc transferase